jgi:outer membrane protein
MNYLIYTLVTSLLFLRVSAQSNEWDLQKCIDYAQNNNITLKQSELTTKINKNNSNQSKAAILPTINSGAQHTYNFGRTIDRYTNTFANSQVLSQNFFISSNVVLWSGFAQYNNVKANEYQYLSSAENYLQQKNDLALNVATAYINVIFTEELLNIAISQQQLTKEQLVRTEKLVSAGTLAKSALFDLKAQLANEEFNTTNADNNYQLAILNLKQTLNLDTLNNFKISKPLLDISDNQLQTLSVQNIYEEALKNQHIIKSANYGLLAAEKNLAVAKGRVSPTISATGSMATGTSELNKKITNATIVGADPIGATQTGEIVYAPKYTFETEKKPFSEQFSENVNKSFGFTLSVPIFNGLQNYTGVKNAQLNALNAKYSEDLAEQNLYKTIAQAYANAKAAHNKLVSSQLSLDASEQSFNFSQQKFDVGALSTFDYSNAKIRLQNAQSNYIQSKFDYVFKLKVLDFYQGKPLTL